MLPIQSYVFYVIVDCKIEGLHLISLVPGSAILGGNLTTTMASNLYNATINSPETLHLDPVSRARYHSEPSVCKTCFHTAQKFKVSRSRFLSSTLSWLTQIRAHPYRQKIYKAKTQAYIFQIQIYHLQTIRSNLDLDLLPLLSAERCSLNFIQISIKI